MTPVPAAPAKNIKTAVVQISNQNSLQTATDRKENK